MNDSSLHREPWEHYGRYHRSRLNIRLHLAFVPLFLVGNVVLLGALVERRWLVALGAAALMAISLAAQGRGHRHELIAPEPFTGPGNAISRLLTEQWVSFPRFVLSGAWKSARNGESRSRLSSQEPA